MKATLSPVAEHRTPPRWSTYIFVHDQAIVLAYEKHNKFGVLPGVSYVFLGGGAVDRISGMSNVIVSRHLPDNIEKYPGFTAFTGWYALWKNGLLDADYLNLFEYDINLAPSVHAELAELATEKPDLIGHLPRPMDEYDYIRNPRWVEAIVPAIKRRYGIDVEELVAKSIRSSPAPRWSSTSNATFSRPCFCDYMRWFEPLIEEIKASETSGHAHERSISFFCQIFSKKVVFSSKVMTHLQLNSHGTQKHAVIKAWAMRKLLRGGRSRLSWPWVSRRPARTGPGP